MNILTLSNYYPEHPGGIEFVALNLVQQWRKRHSVHWMACDVSTHPHSQTMNDVPLRAFNFAEEKLGFPYPIPKIKDFSLIVDQVRWCDILHLHDCLYAANVFAFLTAQNCQKPVVITQHISPVPYQQPYKRVLQNIAYHTVGQYLLTQSHHVVFISQSVKAWFEARLKFKGQTHFIPNGIDRFVFYPAEPDEREQLRIKLGIEPEQFVAIFVGRFTEKKGLYIIKNLAESSPEMLWLLVGHGELDPAAWNLPNIRVFPIQPQASLRSFYVSADVFVLPSVGEGFPLSVQEAMACGLPVCVSRATANILPDAHLIPLEIENRPAMLETLEILHQDCDQRKRMGQFYAAYARRWDWQAVATTYESLFTSQT